MDVDVVDAAGGGWSMVDGGERDGGMLLDDVVGKWKGLQNPDRGHRCAGNHLNTQGSRLELEDMACLHCATPGLAALTSLLTWLRRCGMGMTRDVYFNIG